MAFSYIFRFKNSAMYDKNMRETFCNKFAGSRKDVNMKNLRFDDLYSPEYYMDVPGNDGRIAIKKFNDARDTMAMAHFSLSYIEDTPSDELGKNFAKTIHLRHAIEDLNSSFDLLLQIPWFYFRIWAEFNRKGSLRTKQLKNRNEITRNTQDWVLFAERDCEYRKVMEYLHATSNPLETKMKVFSSEYIEGTDKTFTVRSLCNALKHNHALSFEELYEPYDFLLNINGQKINLREEHMGVRFKQKILEKDNPDIVVGEIKYDYSDDFSIDYEYMQGESFRYEDCVDAKYRLKIQDVYKECCKYFDALVELFEEVYNQIYPQIGLLPTLVGENGKPNIKSSVNSISMNDYFTVV